MDLNINQIDIICIFTNNFNPDDVEHHLANRAYGKKLSRISLQTFKSLKTIIKFDRGRISKR